MTRVVHVLKGLREETKINLASRRGAAAADCGGLAPNVNEGGGAMKIRYRGPPRPAAMLSICVSVRCEWRITRCEKLGGQETSVRLRCLQLTHNDPRFWNSLFSTIHIICEKICMRIIWFIQENNGYRANSLHDFFLRRNPLSLWHAQSGSFPTKATHYDNVFRL